MAVSALKWITEDLKSLKTFVDIRSHDDSLDRDIRAMVSKTPAHGKVQSEFLATRKYLDEHTQKKIEWLQKRIDDERKRLKNLGDNVDERYLQEFEEIVREAEDFIRKVRQ